MCHACQRHDIVNLCSACSSGAPKASCVCRYCVITSREKKKKRLRQLHDVSFLEMFKFRRAPRESLAKVATTAGCECRATTPLVIQHWTWTRDRLSGLANDIHPSIHRSSIIPRSEGCWGQSHLAQCQWAGLHPGQAASASTGDTKRLPTVSLFHWTVAPGLLTTLKDSLEKISDEKSAFQGCFVS